MMKNRKITRFILVGVAIAFTFVILLTYMSLLIIKTKPVQEEIIAFIKHQSNNIIDFQSINLTFFPLPRISIYNIAISVPGTVTGKIESLHIYPKIIPLLSGRILIAKIIIESPNFTVELVENMPNKETMNGSADMLAEIESTFVPTCLLSRS